MATSHRLQAYGLKHTALIKNIIRIKLSYQQLSNFMTNPNFYTHPITVSAADIDVMGHVNNVVYLRYVQ
jgi:acyl-ACP thioesterase